MPTSSNTEYLRPRDAAALLKARFGHGSERTLAKLRCLGGGPIFHLMGPKMIAYTAPELVAWASSKISGPLSSTSEKTVCKVSSNEARKAGSDTEATR
jgi:hypothetical protein